MKGTFREGKKGKKTAEKRVGSYNLRACRTWGGREGGPSRRLEDRRGTHGTKRNRVKKNRLQRNKRPGRMRLNLQKKRTVLHRRLFKGVDPEGGKYQPECFNEKSPKGKQQRQ